MKKNEKKGIIISTILILMGLIGIIYTAIIEGTIENSWTLYIVGLAYFALGACLLGYFIRLSKNEKKSEEQENIYEDERLNSNRDKACAITCRIIIYTSFIADFMVTFFIRQYKDLSDILSEFTFFLLLIYAVVYYFVSKKN